MNQAESWDHVLPADENARWMLRGAAPLVFTALHRIAVGSRSRIEEAIAQCYWLFGEEACFHFVALLFQATSSYDDRLVLSETAAYLFGESADKYKEQVADWMRNVDPLESHITLPDFRGKLRDIVDDLKDVERELRRINQVVTGIASAKAQSHARVVIERFKEVTDGLRLSGDDSGLNDAWEEYVDQIQGQHSMFWGVYVQQMTEIAAAYVNTLPRPELELLWIGSDEYQDMDTEDRRGVDDDAVIASLMREIDSIAVNEILPKDVWNEDVENEDRSDSDL